jgi:hypothetical protein
MGASWIVLTFARVIFFFDRYLTGFSACTVLKGRETSIRKELSSALRNPVGHTLAISI